MPLSIDPQSAVLKDIETLKRHLKSKGYATRVWYLMTRRWRERVPS